jgi:hypothetical protein
VILVQSDAKLSQVVAARCAPGRFPRPLQCGQCQRHEHADDGDDDEQFDEGKAG